MSRLPRPKRAPWIPDPATYDYLGYKVYNQSISLEAYGVVDRIGQRP
jgi:hypothetical protein